MTLAIGLVSERYLLADWLFLIASILFVFLTVVTNSPRALPTGRATAIQSIGFALIAVGLLVL